MVLQLQIDMKKKMFKKLIINNLEQKLVLKIQLMRKILNH